MPFGKFIFKILTKLKQKMISPKNINLSRTKKRGRSIFSRLLFYFAMLSFVGVIIFVLFFSPLVTISAVKITGQKYIDQALILESVNLKTAGKFWGIITKNNYLLLSGADLEKDLLERFRQIRSAEVKKKLNADLEIKIIEKIPTLIICGKECFIADEDGQIYDYMDINSDEAKKFDLIWLNDENKKEMNLGETFIERKYVEYILDIKNKLKEEVNLKINNNFRTPSLISRDIRVKTEEGWEIYFNENIEIKKEIETLKTVLEKKIEKNYQADLEYVDLRVGGKVFYKFRDGTPSEIARKEAEIKSALPEQSAVKEDDKKKKDKD